ncbi:uncharacterized protein LOC127282287 [Leptopilina boulardi]|uniref:uncharacterized protein LOC127282287 n=1 Tax=Leptopilina boulardi TaxID=63433 RepID=UPI0021F55E4B|nr:uncharacterized protein LOC127282287 [Leptopilina boulardi]
MNDSDSSQLQLSEEETDVNIKKRRLSEVSHELETVNEQSQEDNNSIENHLLMFLRASGDGKVILSQFAVHKCLNRQTRSLLTRLIIKQLKDDALKHVPLGIQLEKFHISSKTFTSLANAIAKIFPGEEASIYYSPYKCENGKKIAVSGSLWSNYSYTKDCMRKNNLLSPPVISKQSEVELSQIINSSFNGKSDSF